MIMSSLLFQRIMTRTASDFLGGLGMQILLFPTHAAQRNLAVNQSGNRAPP